MAERKVFGRIELDVNGQLWKIELRQSGLYLRKKHHRLEWFLDGPKLVRLCDKQPLLFQIKEVNIKQSTCKHEFTGGTNTCALCGYVMTADDINAANAQKDEHLCSIPDCQALAIGSANISINNEPKKMLSLCKMHLEAALDDNERENEVGKGEQKV